jgi:hypothetical protein
MLTETPAVEGPPAASSGGVFGVFRRIPPFKSLASPAAAIALTLVALAPVVSVVVQRAGRPYLPLQDQAVVDLRVRDVLTFSHNTPLSGVYSHFVFNHPGPLFFYMAAPLAWVFGYAGWSTLVAFALLQGVAVVWTARLAWKTGGVRWTAIWLSVMAISYLGVGPSLLQFAWNPSIALPFFVLFCLQCWVVARGDPRRLLGLAFVATFLVQTHLGYAPLVALMALWAIARLVVEMVRTHRRVAFFDVAAPAGVLVLLWFPVLVLEPLLDGSSNVARIVHFYLSPGKAQGWEHGLGLLATEFRWLPPWLGGSDPVARLFGDSAIPSALGWLAVPVVLLASAWWVARHRGRSDLSRLIEMLIVLVAGGGIALAELRGDPVSYLFYWRVVAGAATVVLAATVLIEATSAGRFRAANRVWAGILAAAVTVAALSIAPAAGRVPRTYSQIEPIAQNLLAQIRLSGLAEGPILIRPWGSMKLGVAATLLDELAREGKPVYVDRNLGYELGYGRTASPGDVRWSLYVFEDGVIYNLGHGFPGARIIAVTHPLPPNQMTELAHLQQHLAAELQAHRYSGYNQLLSSPVVGLVLGNLPGLSKAELQELGRLNKAVAAHGCECSVVAFPSSRDLKYHPAFMV